MAHRTQYPICARRAAARRRVEYLAVAWILIGSVGACTEAAPSAPPVSRTTLAPRGMAMTSCGASFRMISSTDDSLMDADGLTPTVDTVDVCESWTGNDYAYQATGVGSSDNIPGLADTVQTAGYQGGYVTGYASDGTGVSAASPVGSTAFDYLYADATTVSASYDYPYYGVSSPDPAACTTPPCPVVNLATTTAHLVGTAPTSAAAPSAAQFAAHGLRRRGVRALIDDAQEITPSREGYRRFRVQHGADRVTWSVDPKTELLMAELHEGPADTMVATHTWRAVSGGYVRDRSRFDTDERIGGKHVHSSVALTFQNVKILDPNYVPLRGPDATP